MDKTKQPGLRIVQVLLSAAHFEQRADSLALPSSTPVELKYTLEVEAAIANEGKAGIITLRLKTTDNDDSLYRLQVEMQGVVEAETGSENLSVGEYLTKMGSAMVFPFLREAIANLTGRGRFGAVFLKPFNVGTLVEQPAPEAAAAE